jgi:hypothetical protein
MKELEALDCWLGQGGKLAENDHLMLVFFEALDMRISELETFEEESVDFSHKTNDCLAALEEVSPFRIGEMEGQIAVCFEKIATCKKWLEVLEKQQDHFDAHIHDEKGIVCWSDPANKPPTPLPCCEGCADWPCAKGGLGNSIITPCGRASCWSEWQTCGECKSGLWSLPYDGCHLGRCFCADGCISPDESIVIAPKKPACDHFNKREATP